MPINDPLRQSVEEGSTTEDFTLKEIQERYRDFLEQSTEGIWRIELESPVSTALPEDEQIDQFYEYGYLAECNVAMARMYGYSSARELLGARLSDFLIREDQGNVEYLRAFIRSAYRLADAESHEVDRNGNDLYFLNNLTGIIENGLLMRAWGTQRDITAIKKAQQEREAILKSEQDARADAEAAILRLSFLAEASQILSSSLDYETTLKSVARLAVPFLADWCVVDILEEDGSIHRVAIEHQDSSKAELVSTYVRTYQPKPEDTIGVPGVIRKGEPELISEVSDTRLAAGIPDSEQLNMVRQLGLKSIMIVPLNARGRTLGAITFVTGESGRHYSQDDLRFTEDLAQRAALAVDNARLYRNAETALKEREQAVTLHRGIEERLSVLLEASNTLLSSMHLKDLHQAVLDLSGKLIDADGYAIWRKDANSDSWRVVSALGLSESFQDEILRERDSRKAPKLHLPMPIEDVTKVPWLEKRRDAYQREGIYSVLPVPLMLYGELAGTITFYYRQPHRFTETDIRVATALANLSAAAISTTELYQEQITLRAQAEEANRLKDEFLATVSHELRTPLNAILGWAAVLGRGRLDASHSQKAIGIIERNAKSQSQIINDLLDVSRIITGRMSVERRKVELSRIINVAVETIRPAAEAKEINLVAKIAPNIQTILGDPERLQQVIWNLLSNAVKFTQQNGNVLISAEQLDTSIEIIVSDNGQGIAPEFLPFVFDRFRQEDASTTRRHSGLGLGLAIVRHLVELHGGIVKVESEGIGKGATFTVSLPVPKVITPTTVLRPEESLEIVEDEVAPKLSKFTILAVDDESDTREILKTALSFYGSTVIVASSTAEALSILEQQKVDIIVSDIGMTGEDGYVLMRKVRARGWDLPAVALTAYARLEDKEKALAVGYQKHVPKPVDPHDLMLVITQLLGKAEIY